MKVNRDPKTRYDDDSRLTWRIVGLALLVFVLFLLAFTFWWSLRTWGGLHMDEIVYELSAPLSGTSDEILSGFYLQCLLPANLLAVVVVIVMLYFKGDRRKWAKIASLGLSGLCFVLALGSFWKSAELGAWLRGAAQSSDFIKESYVDPADTELTFPEEKRNLIYIYLESMETSYSDEDHGGYFEEDRIPELTKLAVKNEDFSGDTEDLNGGYVLQGSGWTMAGIFAQSSGLPLRLKIDGNSMSKQESFFPGITTLGDILEDEGYNQVFMCGSDATFGGRRLYFTDHGNFDFIDLVYERNIGNLPEDYYVWWGFEDYRLIDYAKEELLELAEEDEPFNLTLLTVDTHFPDGYFCKDCEEIFEDRYSNVLSCSSKRISEFVKWIQKQDFYENTTLVLVGDHTTMDADMTATLEDYDRKSYVCYINSAVEPEEEDTRREYSTMDLFPTTLAALGVEIRGDRLGLGTNLFSDRTTLIEHYGYDEMNEEFMKSSDFLEEIEQLDAKTNVLLTELARAKVRIVDQDIEEKTVTVRVDGFSEYTDEISTEWVNIWKDGNRYKNSHSEIFTTETGGFEAVIDMSEYSEKDGHVYIQWMVKIPESGTLYLGPMAVIDISEDGYVIEKYNPSGLD